MKLPNVTHDVLDPNDPSGRGGVPPDRLGIYFLTIMDKHQRTNVVAIITPPEALRDAPRETVRAFFRERAMGIADQLAEEVYKGYTSDPLEAAPVQNIADALAEHARTLRKG